MRRRLAVAGALLVVAGCGDGSTITTGDEAKPTLVVSAATSLKAPLTACAKDFPDARVRAQFAGSDALAGQIRQGAKVDVFASADMRLPRQLASAKELEAPVAFIANRLVLAVPADGEKVARLRDLGADGVRIVIGAEGVPIGDYARPVIAAVPGAAANVRSEEPDVAGVVGKLVQGSADAGFVYASDLAAAGDRLREVELPAKDRRPLPYGAGVVAGSAHPDVAEAFIDDLLVGSCHDALIAAGFREP